jgi:hypothetical protein
VGLLVRDAMEAPGGNRGIGDSRLPAWFGVCGVLRFACPLASARGFQGVDLLVVMPWKPPVETGGSAIAVCLQGLVCAVFCVLRVRSLPLAAFRALICLS